MCCKVLQFKSGSQTEPAASSDSVPKCRLQVLEFERTLQVRLNSIEFKLQPVTALLLVLEYVQRFH